MSLPVDLLTQRRKLTEDCLFAISLLFGRKSAKDVTATALDPDSNQPANVVGVLVARNAGFSPNDVNHTSPRQHKENLERFFNSFHLQRDGKGHEIRNHPILESVIRYLKSYVRFYLREIHSPGVPEFRKHLKGLQRLIDGNAGAGNPDVAKVAGKVYHA